jgi:hypothetical protein
MSDQQALTEGVTPMQSNEVQKLFWSVGHADDHLDLRFIMYVEAARNHRSQVIVGFFSSARSFFKHWFHTDRMISTETNSSPSA